MAFILFSILVTLISVATPAPVVRVSTCPVILPVHAMPRIVGGNEASPHTRSHIVSFYEEGCGGSLLSDKWVLTAAHCLIHAGSKARIGGTNSSDGFMIPVKRVVNHPDYEFPKDDITLVELESPAPSSTSYMTVNGNSNVPEVGEFARVAGYGFQGEGFDDDHDALLRQVDVPVMSTKKCIDKYFSVHSYLREDISTEKHLCAGYDNGGCDSCTADSGGPLFVYDDKNSPVQIAIVSFGYGCARAVPGGYTRVSTYVPWMKSVGAVFEEKATRKAVFGKTVSGTSGPQPESKHESKTEEEEEDLVSETGGEDETEEEPANQAEPEDKEQEESPDENGSEPIPEPVSIPTPESVAGTATPASSSQTESETSAGSAEQPNSDEKPITPEPSSKPSTKPSPKPSPPGRLPPNQGVGTASVNVPPSSSNTPAGHEGEGQPRPSASSSTSPSTSGDSSSDSDGNDGPARPSASASTSPSTSDNSSSASDGNDDSSSGLGAAEIGPQPSDGGSDEGENDAPETEVDASGSDDDGNATDGDVMIDDDAVDQAPEGDTASADNNGSEGSTVEKESDVDGGSGVTSDETDANDVATGPGGSNDQDGTGSVVGPVPVPSPSPEVLMPSAQGVEEFEEAEPSYGPEISESPEDTNAPNSETGDEGGGLSGLQVSLIVVGSILAVVGIGFLIYFIIQKVM